MTRETAIQQQDISVSSPMWDAVGLQTSPASSNVAHMHMSSPFSVGSGIGLALKGAAHGIPQRRRRRSGQAGSLPGSVTCPPARLQPPVVVRKRGNEAGGPHARHLAPPVNVRSTAFITRRAGRSTGGRCNTGAPAAP